MCAGQGGCQGTGQGGGEAAEGGWSRVTARLATLVADKQRLIEEAEQRQREVRAPARSSAGVQAASD